MERIVTAAGTHSLPRGYAGRNSARRSSFVLLRSRLVKSFRSLEPPALNTSAANDACEEAVVDFSTNAGRQLDLGTTPRPIVIRRRGAVFDLPLKMGDRCDVDGSRHPRQRGQNAGADSSSRVSNRRSAAAPWAPGSVPLGAAGGRWKRSARGFEGDTLGRGPAGVPAVRRAGSTKTFATK
jgi:hypothetical protein